MKTFSKVLNKDFDFEVIHSGLLVSKDWIHDKYIVFIEGEEFSYSQGIGFREEISNYKKEEFKKLMSMNPKKDKENLKLYATSLKQVSKPKPLKIDDVLNSLLLDADSGNYTFQDFCDNFGYDSDSRSALKTYEDCQNNGMKVRKFIPNISEAYELFQDY